MVGARVITFAYGSNMPTARIRERCPSAAAIGVAELRGYELRWHKASNDGSGKADIVESDVEGASVFGVLYDISPEDKAALDDAERGYKDIQIVVQHNGAEITISAYKATKIDPSRQPYTWYKALAAFGAKEHGLPADYIAQIEAVPAIEDLNRERNDKNMRLITGGQA